MVFRAVLCFSVAIGAGAHAFAHSGPLETIARITDEIAEDGPSASLLVQRAIEYRTVNDYASAKADLEQALALQPANFMALRELAKVDLCVGEYDASLDAINRALKESDGGPGQYGLFALRAEVHGAAGNNKHALTDIARALEAERPEVDWFLQRSRLQWSARDFDRRVRDLRNAAARNPSVVIQYELTDALIDAGQFDESLERVETELAKCRDCAAWRIRRARIRQGIGDDDGARADLKAAIASLTTRLDEQRNSPLDLTTIVDRATAYALLGDYARAERGLQFARALEADDWLTAPLARLVASNSVIGD